MTPQRAGGDVGLRLVKLNGWWLYVGEPYDPRKMTDEQIAEMHRQHRADLSKISGKKVRRGLT
jgi:hypothetical protein